MRRGAPFCLCVAAVAVVGCAPQPQGPSALAGADPATTSTHSAPPEQLTTAAVNESLYTPTPSPQALLTFPSDPTAPRSIELDASVPIAPTHQCATADDGDKPVTRLTDPQSVIAITICREGPRGRLPGEGAWSTRETREVPTQDVAPLAVALAQPDAERVPDTICAAIGYALPSVVAEISDGSTVLLAYPYGECYPLQGPVDLVFEVISSVQPTIERVTQYNTEVEVISGCTGAKPVYPSKSEIAAFPRIDQPSYSLCQYETTDGNSRVIATAAVEATQVTALEVKLASAAPAGCEFGVDDLEVGEFLQIRAVPDVDEDDGAAVLIIGLDACHVVVDEGWTLIGWVEDDAVTALMSGLEPVA